MKAAKFLFLAISLILLSCNNPSGNNQLQAQEKQVVENGDMQIKVSHINFLSGINNDYYLVDQAKNKVYLYTELKADQFQQQDFKRTPVNLSIVIDRSGSMEGEKLERAKEAAIFAVNQLTAEDYVSVVAYESGVQVILNPTKVENKKNITDAISRINSAGGTFLSGGLQKGLELVKMNKSDQFLNRVFLMSDGLANEGIVEIDKLSNIVSEWKKENNTSVSTFGIGIDFDEDLMTELAEAGGGNYYFIEKPEQIAGIFEKEMNGLLNMVAKDVKINVSYPDDKLVLDRVYGYKYDAAPGTIDVNLGDMYSEETKAVMIAFDMKEDIKETIDLLTQLHFIDLTNDYQAENAQLAQKIDPTDSEVLIAENLNKNTMQQATLFESNYQMELAAKELDKGNYDGAKQILDLNTIYLDDKMEEYGSTPELEAVEVSNSYYYKSAEDFEGMDIQEQKTVQKANKSIIYNTRKKKP